jgi:hypothetical protein
MFYDIHPWDYIDFKTICIRFLISILRNPSPFLKVSTFPQITPLRMCRSVVMEDSEGIDKTEEVKFVSL